MLFNLYNILPPLQPYIKVITSMELTDDDSGVSSFRVLPDACVELFVVYKTNRIASVKGKNFFEEEGSFVTSRMNSYMDVQMQKDSACIAVCFHPGKAHHFFNCTMSELTNHTVSLQNLWGEKSSEMEDSVTNAIDNNSRVEIVQHFLLTVLNKTKRQSPAFEHSLWQINYHRGQLPVNALVNDNNISQRQLSRQFDTFLGLSPKEYSRINRFLSALNHFKTASYDHLTGIAYESGYFDQSHFIHECREFTGLSPKEIISSRNIIY